MAKKIFVGGVSWDTNEESLRKTFEAFGEITEVKIIKDLDTGRSRGFAFLTFVHDEDATRAISTMHGTELDGRNITVNEAQEKTPRRDNRGGRFSR